MKRVTGIGGIFFKWTQALCSELRFLHGQLPGWTIFMLCSKR